MISIVPLVVEIVIVPVVGSVIDVTSAFGSVPVLAPPPVHVTTVPDFETVWLVAGTPADAVVASMSQAIKETAMAKPRQRCLVNRASRSEGMRVLPRVPDPRVLTLNPVHRICQQPRRSFFEAGR